MLIFQKGPHHDFCYVCGGTMELFGCQTCEISFHSSCMTPTLQADDVPTFWFCPHCVDRDLHIPPELPEPGGGELNVRVYPSPTSTETTKESALTMVSNSIARSNESPINQDGSSKAQPQITTAASSKMKTAASRSKRTYSPPRKRSKYSSLSSEVDKALAVIQKELETAANVGRTEDKLREKVKSLEQQLKLKDGQIKLTERELGIARRKPSQSDALKAELAEIKQQNAALKVEVEKKDAELQDWRTKLQGMLGSVG